MYIHKLRTSYGKDYAVLFAEIESSNFHTNETNCVLIVAKEEGDGLKLIEIKEIIGPNVTVSTYFATWPGVYDDGSYVHHSRHLGASIYGIIAYEDEIQTRNLAKDLNEVYKPKY